MIEGRKPVTSNAAYRRLAIAILGFDSATLTSELDCTILSGPVADIEQSQATSRSTAGTSDGHCQDRRALDRRFQYALTTGAPLGGAGSGSLTQSAISKVG
jgi:hypothetical protein